jgi:maltooligosyltrehalose trehalohydrolase
MSAAPSLSRSLAPSFGATLIAPDRTRFRLWAPAQTAVTIEVEGLAPMPMAQLADGWFETEARCGAGARYRFRLQCGLAVPDPASRAQAADVHGPSVVMDPNSYVWKVPQWRERPWHEAVIYELHVGLCDGFAGVARELPRLAELGVTAIELMPIADFPGRRNWGYDGVLPFAPARSYGTPDDLKALVDAAHARGLMIFLDVVYNHFGPDGNYLSTYAPEMFRTDVVTPWGPAIDFRRPPVRRFFTQNALYWLTEFRFDGLRFDAVHAITEADWLDEMAADVRASMEAGRHVHLVLENDANAAGHLAHDFDAQWNDDGHHVLHVLLTGEHEGYYQDYADRPAERLARCLAQGFIYQGEPSAHRGGKPRGSPSTGLAPTAFVLFLQNHDQIGNRALGERLTALVEAPALEAAIALVLLCPQIPLIFMGEEYASRTPFLFFTDHKEELAQAVREGRRREFASFAGFANPKRLLTLPDPNSPETFDASRPKPDPACGRAREALYRRLIALRRDEIMPRLKGAHSLDGRLMGRAAVCARWRMGDGRILTLASNLGRESADIEAQAGSLLFASTHEGERMARLGRLAPHCTLAFLEPSA